MERITFECETITPMFLSGADGKTPELRPPSIKAAMRFWWRAINADKTISDFRKEEAEIFGGSGETGGRSKFSIKTKLINKEIRDSLREKVWDEKNNSIKPSFEGLGYLLYSTFMQADNKKPYFGNLKFSLEISSSSSRELVKAVNSLWFLVTFGALGSRSRRGAGNFRIVKIIDEKNLINSLTFSPHAEDKDALKNILEMDIKKISKKPSTISNEFSNLSNARAFILDYENSWEECLELLGKNYKNFRTKRQPDYSTVKDYLQTGTITTLIEKAEMGLPLSYKYRSLNGKSALIEGSNKERQRSASPIIFKIIASELSNKIIYFPIVLIYYRDLLPTTDKIKIKETRNKAGKSPKNIGLPGIQIINDFIAQLPTNVEVTL